MSKAEDNERLLDILLQAYQIFASRPSPDAWRDPVRLDGKLVFGVDVAVADGLDRENFRNVLLGNITCMDSSTINILQVVGDSGTSFAESMIHLAQTTLANHILESTVVEYGFTSSGFDANWLVADHIAQHPSVAARTLANVVGQSSDALSSASWTGSDAVTSFVLLYSHDDTLTSFGDDTWLSDGIMSAAYRDKMICLEGGPQAFHQCVNMLVNGIRVVAVAGLRTNSTQNCFSAARLLLELKRAEDLSKYQEVAATYLDLHPPKSEHQATKIQNDIERLALCGHERNLDDLIQHS